MVSYDHMDSISTYFDHFCLTADHNDEEVGESSLFGFYAPVLDRTDPGKETCEKYLVANHFGTHCFIAMLFGVELMDENGTSFNLTVQNLTPFLHNLGLSGLNYNLTDNDHFTPSNFGFAQEVNRRRRLNNQSELNWWSNRTASVQLQLRERLQYYTDLLENHSILEDAVGDIENGHGYHISTECAIFLNQMLGLIREEKARSDGNITSATLSILYSRMHLKQSTEVLELTLWKKEIDGGGVQQGEDDEMFRQRCHNDSRSKADIIVPLVMKYVGLKIV